MKTMKIRRIMFMMLAAFSLASCSSDNEQEKPYTTDPVENAVFTESDIEWFNPTTREVKFYAQEESLSQRLRKTDGELQFRLGNDVVLKVSRFVGDWDSRTFKDLVLHYDVISNSEQGHFYLQDCYPLQFMNDEQVQTNIKKNAEQWNAFIKYLERIGKIKKWKSKPSSPHCSSDMFYDAGHFLYQGDTDTCVQQISSVSLHSHHVSTSRTISAPCRSSWAISIASLLPPKSPLNLASAASNLSLEVIRFVPFLAGTNDFTKACIFVIADSLSRRGLISRNNSARNSIAVIIVIFLFSGAKLQK